MYIGSINRETGYIACDDNENMIIVGCKMFSYQYDWIPEFWNMTQLLKVCCPRSHWIGFTLFMNVRLTSFVFYEN